MNLKNKLNIQKEQRQNHQYGEHFDGCQMGGECGGRGEEVRGLRSTNRQLQNSHGDIKYSIGNGAAKEPILAKEPICITHGHKQWHGDCLRQ